MSQPSAVASASFARSSPRCQLWTSLPRFPSGFSRLWSGPATKPSSEIDMWQVVSGLSVLQAIAVCKRRHGSLASPGQIAASHAKRHFCFARRMLLLCQGEVLDRPQFGNFINEGEGVDRLSVAGGAQALPDGPGEVALEGAKRLHPRLALGLLAGQELACGRMHPPLGDRDSMQGAVGADGCRDGRACGAGGCPRRPGSGPRRPVARAWRRMGSARLRRSRRRAWRRSAPRSLVARAAPAPEPRRALRSRARARECGGCARESRGRARGRSAPGPSARPGEASA